tara:strand:+ start:919 stop:1197 length:279 start_codon:yes stop_codon:yes gene_type:complete
VNQVLARNNRLGPLVVPSPVALQDLRSDQDLAALWRSGLALCWVPWPAAKLGDPWIVQTVFIWSGQQDMRWSMAHRVFRKLGEIPTTDIMVL